MFLKSNTLKDSLKSKTDLEAFLFKLSALYDSIGLQVKHIEIPQALYDKIFGDRPTKWVEAFTDQFYRDFAILPNRAGYFIVAPEVPLP